MPRTVETPNRRPPPMVATDREADEIARRSLWERIEAGLAAPLPFPPDYEAVRQ